MSNPTNAPSAPERPATSPPAGPTDAPTFGQALARVFRQPAFLVALIILLPAAIGLNLAVGAMKLHFKKAPVPLARELGAIPNRVGPWVQVSQDKALNKDTQDVLGTDKYIFRDYVDTRVAGETVAEQFKDKSEEARGAQLEEIRKKFPQAVVRFSVTYYTGMVDTVSHVPDRCVTADGFEPKTYETPKWAMGRDLPSAAKPIESGAPSDNIEVRHIHFEDQTGATASTITRSISYFFHANGQFMSSPLMVRQKLADLWAKKGYYCKIETMNTLDRPEESAKAMTDFLTVALPEVYKCMPDWAAETGAKPAAEVAQK